MTDIQSLHTFNCHCMKISADQYEITADLSNCNFTDNMTAYFEVHHGVNLAFLSQFFDLSELIHLSADTTLNHSILIDMPALKRADKDLDEKFAIHETTRFDMLDIGNMEQSFVLPIMTLMHPVSSYRFSINRGDVQMRLIDKAFYSELWWRNGIMLIENYCELPIVCQINCRYTAGLQKKMKLLMSADYYVCIQLLSQRDDSCEIVVLRPFLSERDFRLAYPTLPGST